MSSAFSSSQSLTSAVGHDSLNTSFLDELIIKEINEERKRQRLKILTYDKSISEISHRHVEWMIAKDTFEHSHNGYEIIEINYFDHTITYDSLAKDVVKVWMNSPGHRSIILKKGLEGIIGAHAGVFSKETTTNKYLYPPGIRTCTKYEIRISANFGY